MSGIILGIRVFFEILVTIILTLIGLIFLPFPIIIKAFCGKHILRLWAWLSCKIFGIRVNIIGPRNKIKAGTLVISNHVTFWDIFVLGSLFPTVFLSKAEVKKIPFVGIGAWALGVIFVDRSSVQSGAKSIRSLVQRLKNGTTIISFPEGSTTKIEEIRSFKVGSFHAVSKEDIPIQIICINYDNFEDEGWADEDFNSHFLRLAKKRVHNAYVIFGESFIAKGDAPKDIRKRAYESMKKSFDITKKVKYGHSKN